jgi:hypothetical protein
MFPFLLFPARSAGFSFPVYHALCRKAKPGVFHGFFIIHAGNRAIRAGFIDFFPQMRYIQSNLIFYGFTISFHHSKEVFVCCLIVSLRCVFWVALSIRGAAIRPVRPLSGQQRLS